MKKKLNVLGTGFSGLDIIKNNNEDIYLPGGTCANVLSVLSSLGWESNLIKAKYQDDWNEYVESKLKELGVNIINYKNSRKNTPRVVQVTKNEKHHFFTTCPLCKRKLINLDLPLEKHLVNLERLFYNLDVLYYDRISYGIKALVTQAQNNNIWSVYEPNTGRSYKHLLDNISEANIVKFSSERIFLSIANKLKKDLVSIDSHTKIIIITHGKKGITFSVRQQNALFSEWEEIEADNIENIIDTSGAGDWLTAGFINNFIKEYPKVTNDINASDVISALRSAQSLSKICCSSIGALGHFYKNIRSQASFTSVNQCTFCKSE